MVNVATVMYRAIENLKATKYITFFLESMPEKELEYNKRVLFLEMIKSNTSDMDEVIIDVVNNGLVDKVQNCLENSNCSMRKYWQPIIRNFSFWLMKSFQSIGQMNYYKSVVAGSFH